ncbi:N-6 DNA methylase [Aliarcobacter butzleri]|uniref:Eco57I restriction-modification methylase domain-containing protein n=1 Tax=Aliarcobacter butzleri TaxID=28197 RepID=UPI001ED9E561|nr:N-6 DNA methylase [Aliarcobacter butzleri]MCG3701525.1 N-6 DNA methylase [Aliarcobacter butzleri]
MTKQKSTGSFYTPFQVSNFISKYLYNKITNKNIISILEPSVGDGSFVDALVKNINKNCKVNITIVDINNIELEKAKIKAINSRIFNKIESYNKDFLNFYYDDSSKYSLVLGNPPYVKSNLLDNEQLELCKRIHKEANLKSYRIKNLWTPFVIGSCNLLEEDGIIAFVLPTDLLQVKYAEEIRSYLTDNFERIEIFTLDRFAFSDIEQHTMILFAYKKSSDKGTFFYSISDIEKIKYSKISSNGLMIYEYKWTHYNLNQKEIKLLNKINERLDRVTKFIDSKPGIVTGANKYFIIDQKTLEQYKLHNYVEPILQKSLFVQSNFEITKDIIQTLKDKNKPMYLLNIKETTKINKDLIFYLDIGIKNNIDKRYKCFIRNKWFCIPNITNYTDGFIFKRYHKFPKVIKDSCGIHVTDGAYKITMKTGYDINSFIYSFFNIITLIFAELTGRKYGGGVMELIPSEFKNLPMYYNQIDEQKFKNFKENFNKNEKLTDDVFEYLELSHDEVNSLYEIYNKLINARMH